jgi:hypothetical protein
MRARRERAADLPVGDLPVADLPVTDLPVIDLTDERQFDARFDRANFEDAYAELAFGLGVVPRRRHRHEPLWERPVVLLAVVALAILVLVAST